MPNDQPFEFPPLPRPTPEAIALARQLRKTQTPHERILWNELRNRQAHGLKFRRQHPIGPYVTDFCCLETRIIVELDGSHHLFQREYDQDRTDYFEAHGFRVLRFRNEEVLGDLSGVMEAIVGLPSPPTPLPRGEGSKRFANDH